MNTPTSAHSEEVKKLLREWCKMQKERYGENWKEILAAEISESTTTKFLAFLDSNKIKLDSGKKK